MLKTLIDLLIPSRCAACGARGEPCCAGCAATWGTPREVVRPPTAGLVRVFSLARYRGVGRKLLIAYKERGRRDLAPSLGRVLAEALAELPLAAVGGGVASAPAALGRSVGAAVSRDSSARVVSSGERSVGVAVSGEGSARAVASGDSPARAATAGERSARAVALGARSAETAASGRPVAGGQPSAKPICLVPAPSRPSAARVRGGPHIERLANAAASVLAARGIEVVVAPALELAGSARDAVGLGREQRMANLAGRLRFRAAGRPPPGIRIVVLDDVITTGATAAACTRALAAEGFAVSAVLTLLAAG